MHCSNSSVLAQNMERCARGYQACNLDIEALYNMLTVQVMQLKPCCMQGFIQLKLSGETMHLDVDTLNERLKLKGAERMRAAMRPDEAFGMIFSWDGVIADMRKVHFHA